VNHLCAVLNRNLDDFVSGKVGADWRVLSSLANDVRLVSLCDHLSVEIRQVLWLNHTLPVHAEPVLIAEDGDCMQGQLVSLPALSATNSIQLARQLT
jgi:hypothetical protein